MNEHGIDRLFLRYRKQGDPAALGAVFDRAAPELYKLALHLVRNPIEAEDVLQATFVAAIEGADSFDASRPLMPWLTGILARQAGLARRRARRVVEEDRLTPRFSEDPAESAALKEFSEELVVALQALPDTYREVLWLHLADGRRPAEIAHDLNRAPGTVRMQMHRGLDLLRRSLPTGFSALGGVGFGGARGLDAIRADVLAEAAVRHPSAPLAPTGAPPAPAPLFSISLGGAFASLPWLLGAALFAALAGVAWWRLSAAGALEVAKSDSADERAASSTLSTRRSDVAPENGRTAQQTGKATDFGASAPASWLRGRVLGLGAGEAAETALSVRGLARFTLPAELVVRGVPAADGSFELDVSRLFAAANPKRPLEELVVEADHPRYVHAVERVPLQAGAIERTAAGERVDSVEIELALAGRATGRVLAPDGAAVAGAAALLFALEDGAPLDPAVDRVLTGADGAYTLRARRAGPHAVVIVLPEAAPVTLAATLQPGSASALGASVLDEGAVIEGHAFHGNQPMRAKGLVSANTLSSGPLHAFEGARFLWTGDAFVRSGSTVETDEHGHFLLRGLAPGRYQLGVSRAAEQGTPAS
ncbi:MAG TPA: sigma-70 family RNA polymerase sigma factor, partial [Planctomycetota bacterium]|nr:sigma-70 family RNA polymerase sigma factor [Planctomycetota bacterium]